jgi:rhodanese-related sulfurtransferase
MIQKAFLITSVLFLTASFPGIARAAAGADCKAKSEASYPVVTGADVQKAVAAGNTTFIDANGNDSYQEKHIGNAIHFNSKKSMELAKALPADKNAPIIAYCGGPSCTAWHKAATAACEAGYTNISHYKDGISGWKKLNSPAKM